MKDYKKSVIRNFTAAQAEAYVFEPLFEDLNVGQSIRRANALIETNEKDCIKGALTAMGVMGFGQREAQNSVVPTVEELKEKIVGAIATLWNTYGEAGINHTEARFKLEALGYDVFIQRDGALNWSFANGLYSGVLQPPKTVSPLPNQALS